MKLEAKVRFTEAAFMPALLPDTTTVNVDADYVSAYEDDIREWVANELAEMYGHTFGDDEFEITNLNELMEDLNFDEFEHKTQYSNM